MKYTITYDEVDPDDTEGGEASDRGFVLPGGYDWSVVDEPVGPGFAERCDVMGVAYTVEVDEDETLQEACARVVRDVVPFADWNHDESWYGQPDQDFRTGMYRTLAIHFEPEAGEVDAGFWKRVNHLVRA